jgi:hypothetical protein
MATDRFAGNPVTFVSTVPFGSSRTATRWSRTGLRACSPHERSDMRKSCPGFRQAHRATPSEHSERVHVGLENGLVLAPLVCILLAQVH